MEQTTGPFSLPTLVRKKIEKVRRQEKDARIHQRLSALGCEWVEATDRPFSLSPLTVPPLAYADECRFPLPAVQRKENTTRPGLGPEKIHKSEKIV
jgi:hypothetical protein